MKWTVKREGGRGEEGPEANSAVEANGPEKLYGGGGGGDGNSEGNSVAAFSAGSCCKFKHGPCRPMKLMRDSASVIDFLNSIGVSGNFHATGTDSEELSYPKLPAGSISSKVD